MQIGAEDLAHGARKPCLVGIMGHWADFIEPLGGSVGILSVGVPFRCQEPLFPVSASRRQRRGRRGRRKRAKHNGEEHDGVA